MMTRDEAQKLVDTVKFRSEQYSVVTVYIAQRELGDRYELLRTDPIRNKGPSYGLIYSWNLVDYLCTKDPMGKNR